MEIEYADLNGSIHIGVSILATESHALVPIDTPESLIDTITQILDVNIIKVAEKIISPLAIGNSNGFVISSVISKEVVSQIETTNLPVYQVPEFFAFGNVVLVNDYGGIISPIIPTEICKKIEETLEIRLKTGTIANSDLVGSLGYATNIGGLITPLASDDELEIVKKSLNLRTTRIGSINRGSEFIASGIVGNTKGLIIGRETTGIEVMEITRCFSE